MAQAEAFETDFWKDANLRKVWDDIVPGEPRKTIPYTLTRDAIELYCASVGEDHPIYFDEDYAKASVYRGLIAPPSIHILLMFSCTPADDWMRSPGTVNAGQSWSYNIPARPGDVIRLEARALELPRHELRRAQVSRGTGIAALQLIVRQHLDVGPPAVAFFG